MPPVADLFRLDGRVALVTVASRASDYINGHVLAVDGGWLGR